MVTHPDNSVIYAKKLLFSRKIPFICCNLPFIMPIIYSNIPFIRVDKNDAGFTLIELIITLTIAGILSAFAIPAIQSFILNQRLTNQANELIGDLNYARSEAIRRGTRVVVCKQGGSVSSPSCGSGATWGGGRVVFVDTDSDGVLDSGETVLRVQQALEGNNTLNSIGSTTSAIVYESTGLITLTSGEITLRLCDTRTPSQAVNVYISSTGRTRTDRSTGVACA